MWFCSGVTAPKISEISEETSADSFFFPPNTDETILADTQSAAKTKNDPAEAGSCWWAIPGSNR